MLPREAAEAYHRDGAVLIKQVLDTDWVDLLRDGLEAAYTAPDGMSVDPQTGWIDWTPASGERQVFVDTLGDIDFFGFDSGVVGDPVPSFGFDNREPDDGPEAGGVYQRGRRRDLVRRRR